MNNKGFAVTGFIYTVFIIFIGVMITILSLFNNRKNILDNLKKDALKNVNEINININEYDTYTKTNMVHEFTARSKGYYRFILESPKIGDTKGSTVQFEMFMTKGEPLYILIGSNNYNEGATEIRLVKNDPNTAIARASYNVDKNFVVSEYLERVISDVRVTNNNVDKAGSVTPGFITKTKINDDLNRVQYIKDCISGNEKNDENNWSEIKVIVDGDNKAKDRNVFSPDKTAALEENPYSNITDGLNNTFATSSKKENQCVVLDLGRTYNVDTISVLHKANTMYYESKIYVSSDGNNYKLVRSEDERESSGGLVVSSYEDKKVTTVGNVSVPVKEFAGATWIRVFHHNNLGGKIYWDSLAQPMLDGGYDENYKQSILYNIAAYISKNNQYEFLLTYSDLDGYNRWIQTSNPINTVEDVTGYSKVEMTWETDGWHGLAKTNLGDTLLKGSVTDDSSYFVGALRGVDYITKVVEKQGENLESENTETENSESTENGETEEQEEVTEKVDVQGIKVNSEKITKGSTDLWVRIDNLKG